jgi:hypothetical protein
MRPLFIIGLVALPSTAYAYLDSATGSMIFQAVAASFFAALITAKIYWARIKAFFKRTPPPTPEETPQ